jgi:hypothetical protein
MKNLKNVENTSGISELNSVEMNEIVGGSFWSRLVDAVLSVLVVVFCIEVVEE